MANVLLVEHDPKLSERVLDLALSEGHCLSIVNKHRQLEDLICGRSRYAVIVLDRKLEEIDSKTLLPDLKLKWPEASILHLEETDFAALHAALLNI